MTNNDNLEALLQVPLTVRTPAARWCWNARQGSEVLQEIYHPSKYQKYLSWNARQESEALQVECWY
jgi:hypothetical protein